MTKFALVLSALLVVPPGARAQNTAPNAPQNAPADYESQKTALKAAKFSTIAELRAAAPALVGKAVELKGEVKGIFARNGSLAALFQPLDGSLIVIEAPASLKGLSALRPGSFSRLLARFDGLAGNDVKLLLLNATDKPEPATLFKLDDDPGTPVILTPMTDMILPQPGAILSPAGPPAPVGNASPMAQTGALGIDAGQKVAYKTLALRYNPRLADDMADQIATALLAAAANTNIDPRFLAAIVSVESSFDPYCLSSSGAMGLGQLMPFNLKGLGITNAWEPMQNLYGAARMLRTNLNRFGAYKDSTLLAVAAYHAGGTAVQNAGFQVPNKPATQRYVWKVYYAYKALAPELFH